MPRELSPLALSESLAVETGEVFINLLELDHSSLAAPYRLVNNTENITHESNEYIAYPFDIVLAADDGARLPEVTLTIDNVDRSLVDVIRSIAEPPVITLKLVLASQPNIVELEVRDLTLRSVSYNEYTISGTLFADDILNSRYPEGTIDISAGYDGAFR